MPRYIFCEHHHIHNYIRKSTIGIVDKTSLISDYTATFTLSVQICEGCQKININKKSCFNVERDINDIDLGKAKKKTFRITRKSLKSEIFVVFYCRSRSVHKKLGTIIKN